MSAIVLVSMPADHDRVRNIAGELSASDLDVYWERAAPGGPDWAQAVEEVEAARCAIFFWSAATAGPEAAPYVALAQWALAENKAICVRLDGGAAPDGVTGCTIYDLRGWRARASSLFMLDLVAGAKAKAAGLDPPLPRAPRQLFFRKAAIWIVAALTFVSTAIGFYETFGVSRLLGLDSVLDPEEATAWAGVRPGSCDDLRAYLSAHNDGVHAAEAQALLAARTVRTETRWQPAERPLPLYVASGMAAASANEASAREAALARAASEADRSCRGLARAASARLRAASARADGYQCERFGSGTVCALEGEAVCKLEEPVEASIESCAKKQ